MSETIDKILIWLILHLGMKDEVLMGRSEEGYIFALNKNLMGFPASTGTMIVYKDTMDIMLPSGIKRVGYSEIRRVKK